MSIVADSNDPARADRIRQQAISWYVRLCSGEASEIDRRDWLHWHQQHADHQAAWQRIESIRLAAQRVPAHIAAPALRAAKNRRQVLKGIVGLGGTAMLGYASYRAVPQTPWRAWTSGYRTRVGERRAVELSDGSRLLLNTDSAADVYFDTQQRLIRLWRGEVLVETAAHRGRALAGAPPLMVETRQGRVVALGTRFIVRTTGERTAVTVQADAVEIHLFDRTDRAVVGAGQQVSFSPSAIGARETADAARAAWEQGSLIVDNQRLDRVIAELDRYRPGRLRCDSSVAELRVSGALPIDDTDRALSVLAKSLPVRIERTTRYWVSVGPR